MTLSMTINVRGLTEFQTLLKKYPKIAREELGKAKDEASLIYRNKLKTYLALRSKRFKNKIYNSIRSRRISDFRSEVVMAQEGVWLDSMRPHWVSLKRGRLITEWAKTRGIKARAIQVRPHPFVDDARLVARKDSQKVYRQVINRINRRVRR